MSFSIRAATRKDIDAIMDLSAITLEEHRARHPDHFTNKAPVAGQYLKDIFAKRLKGGAFVAEENGHIIGWTGFSIYEVPDANNTHDLLGLILDLTVTEAARRRGVGTALIDSLVESARAQGATKLYGDVWLGAPSASVLTRAGIKPVKVVHEMRLANRKKGPPPTNRKKAQMYGALVGLLIILSGIFMYEAIFR